MALLTVQPRAGALTMQDCDAGGDTFSNDGRTEVFLENRGGADRTVTVVAARDCSHGFRDHQVETVPGGAVIALGPFRANRFNDSEGLVSLTYDATTDLLVGAKRQQ